MKVDVLRQSKDNFYKKVASSKGFQYQKQTKGEIYQTLIQMLKSDLIQLQEMINSNSSDIKMYKILSKSQGLSRKLTEIEDSQEIKAFIDRIIDDSQNVEKISKSYDCQSTNELIKKMYQELSLNELLLKKMIDYFLLVQLKTLNDDTYQDSLSKVLPLKLLIEKICNKLNSNSSNNSNNLINNTNESRNKLLIDEFIKIKSINDLFSKNDDNIIISHIKKIINEFLSKVNDDFNKILIKYNENYFEDNKNELEKLNDTVDNVEQLLYEFNKKSKNSTSPNEVENLIKKYKDEIKDKDNEITKLKNQLNSNETQIKIESLNKIISEHSKKEENYKNEIEKLKSNNNISGNSKKTTNSSVSLTDITSMQEKEFQKFKNESLKLIKNEINELEEKVTKLTENNRILLNENESLQKQNKAFNSKNFDPDSYEQVLLEQFETMKNAFVKEVEELTGELNSLKSESRSKIYSLEMELKECQHLKDLFLKQVIRLQE